MANIPESIDKYKLEALIASGGMGAVYKGIHPTLDRAVILKKLTLKGDASMTKRFRREARLLTDFRNDYIVDVYDHFKIGKNHYIVMEFVDGASVQALLLSERYFDNGTAAYVTLQTAKALAYAHAKNVVHRDIKPDNVLISKDGEVKLADFGIATSREEGDENLTSEGMTLGTPSYMAPEQFQDSRTVGAKADLYSLGVMLYEMLTGKKPYPGRFSPELVRAIQRGRYKKPRRINPSVAPELQRLVRKLLRTSPVKRCADAEEVIRKLRRFLRCYERETLEERLKALVSKSPLEPLKLRRRGAGAWISLAAGGFLITVAVVGLLAGLTGLHKRVADPAAFGEVRFVLEGVGLAVAPAEVSTTLYVEDGTTALPERIRYAGAADEIYRDPESIALSSLPRALPVGAYRAVTRIGGREIVTAFPVTPWRESGAQLVLTIPLETTVSRPLSVTTEVTDSVSGDYLGTGTRVDVLEEGAFVPIARAKNLFAGGTYTFRIGARGYKPRIFVLTPARETGSLTIQTALEKEAN